MAKGFLANFKGVDAFGKVTVTFRFDCLLQLLAFILKFERERGKINALVCRLQTMSKSRLAQALSVCETVACSSKLFIPLQ